MANCPICTNTKLAATQVASTLSGLGCARCGGLLLGLVNYRSWRETHATDVAQDQAVNSRQAVAASTREACQCPKCSALMTKYHFSVDNDAQLDFCYHCEEIWFDKGEWALLSELSLEDELTQIFTHPWQHALLEKKISQTERQRWRERFGDEFQRIEQTTEWIKNHPKKSQIVAYLFDAIRHD